MTRGPISLILPPAFYPVVLAFGLFTACSSDNDLSGSLEDHYRLQFDQVRARLYSSEFALEYVMSSSGAVPVRVTLNRKTLRENNKRLKAGESYDLAKYGDITGRQPDGTEIFRFTTGSLDLETFKSKQDAKTEGSFDAKVRAGDDIFTLSGDFSADLEIIPEPHMP